VAESRPDLIDALDAEEALAAYLDSDVAAIRGLAARALGIVGSPESCSKLERLLSDTAELTVYHDQRMETLGVAQLAQEALLKIKGRCP
jgi:HEAT repeat protein